MASIRRPSPSGKRDRQRLTSVRALESRAQRFSRPMRKPSLSPFAGIPCCRSMTACMRSRFKRYPIGFFHIDIAEVRTEQGKLYLLVAIDRTSKFAFVQLHQKATRRIAGDFLRALAAAVPYTIRIVLTDNGTHFTEPTGDGWTPEDIRAMRAQGVPFRCHSFEAACADLDVEHRLTKPRHPWTNGQVERMNRTLKDATVKRFHYATHDQLRTHLADFVAAYNFARRLKTLRGLTPYEAICKAWTDDPQRFTLNPLHQMPGLNN